MPPEGGANSIVGQRVWRRLLHRHWSSNCINIDGSPPRGMGDLRCPHGCFVAVIQPVLVPGWNQGKAVCQDEEIKRKFHCKRTLLTAFMPHSCFLSRRASDPAPPSLTASLPIWPMDTLQSPARSRISRVHTVGLQPGFNCPCPRLAKQNGLRMKGQWWDSTAGLSPLYSHKRREQFIPTLCKSLILYSQEIVFCNMQWHNYLNNSNILPSSYTTSALSPQNVAPHVPVCKNNFCLFFETIFK